VHRRVRLASDLKPGTFDLVLLEVRWSYAECCECLVRRGEERRRPREPAHIRRQPHTALCVGTHFDALLDSSATLVSNVLSGRQISPPLTVSVPFKVLGRIAEGTVCMRASAFVNKVHQFLGTFVWRGADLHLIALRHFHHHDGSLYLSADLDHQAH